MTRTLLGGLTLAGLMILTAVLAKYAQAAHIIAPDTATRAVQAAIGLSLAVYANFMPKRVAAERTRIALRAGGWAFTLAGLGYALLWAFADRALAEPLSTALVGAALLICLGYAMWACAARPRVTD
jgi:hypothetical protein